MDKVEAVEIIMGLETLLAMQACYLAQVEYKIHHGHYATDAELRAYLLTDRVVSRCFWDAELTRRKESLHGTR